MQNLASKILCIFVTGGAYTHPNAPYTPCLSMPLDLSLSVFAVFRLISHGQRDRQADGQMDGIGPSKGDTMHKSALAAKTQKVWSHCD